MFLSELCDILEVPRPDPTSADPAKNLYVFDRALERAFHQGRGYITSLPVAEGRPPFLMVCDVGHNIDLYAEFSGLLPFQATDRMMLLSGKPLR